MLAIQKVCLFEVGKQVKLECIHEYLPHTPQIDFVYACNFTYLSC